MYRLDQLIPASLPFSDISGPENLNRSDWARLPCVIKWLQPEFQVFLFLHAESIFSELYVSACHEIKGCRVQCAKNGEIV